MSALARVLLTFCALVVKGLPISLRMAVLIAETPVMRDPLRKSKSAGIRFASLSLMLTCELHLAYPAPLKLP